MGAGLTNSQEQLIDIHGGLCGSLHEQQTSIFRVGLTLLTQRKGEEMGLRPSYITHHLSLHVSADVKFDHLILIAKPSPGQILILKHILLSTYRKMKTQKHML